MGSVCVCLLLRQDLGLEGNSLNDILYKNAAFLNLVDPISHELLLSLAREMQRPKKVNWLRLLLNILASRLPFVNVCRSMRIQSGDVMIDFCRNRPDV